MLPFLEIYLTRFDRSAGAYSLSRGANMAAAVNVAAATRNHAGLSEVSSWYILCYDLRFCHVDGGLTVLYIFHKDC